MHFVIDEAMDAIALREAVNEILFVNGNAVEERTRHADVEDAVSLAGHDVDARCFSTFGRHGFDTGRPRQTRRAWMAAFAAMTVGGWRVAENGADGVRRVLSLPVRQLEFDAAVAAQGFFAGAGVEGIELAVAGGDQAGGGDTARDEVADDGDRAGGREVPVRGEGGAGDRAYVGMPVDLERPVDFGRDRFLEFDDNGRRVGDSSLRDGCYR